MNLFTDIAFFYQSIETAHNIIIKNKIGKIIPMEETIIPITESFFLVPVLIEMIPKIKPTNEIREQIKIPGIRSINLRVKNKPAGPNIPNATLKYGSIIL